MADQIKTSSTSTIHALLEHMSPTAKKTLANHRPGTTMHGAVSVALFTRGLITTNGDLTELGHQVQQHLTKEESR